MFGLLGISIIPYLFDSQDPKTENRILAYIFAIFCLIGEILVSATKRLQQLPLALNDKYDILIEYLMIIYFWILNIFLIERNRDE